MTVPYTFGTATTSIPLSNLDANFNTPITLGNTSIYLGNTTTTIGNLTLTNATISSGNVTISNVTVTTANVTNITVTGTANIATGNITTLTSTSITDSGLTSGRVTYAGASGLLSDSANLVFTGTNLGISTASPVNALQVAGAVATTGSAGGYVANMALLDVSGGNAQITAIGANTSTVGTLVFQAFSSNASLGAERMRIDSSGTLLVATTTNPTTGGTPRGVVSVKQLNDTSGFSGIQVEANANTNLLGIGYNGSTFSFEASYRSTGGYVPISFTVGGSESMRINTLGGLKVLNTIGVGNTTPSTSGAGITFPATQSASSDANTLDDYEEGTWTPNQGSGLTVVGAFSSTAFYTKTGRMVTVTGKLQGATSIALAGNGQLCSNLPFTAINTAASTSGGGIAYDSAPTTGIVIFTNSNATVLVGAAVALPASANIYFSATYTAAS